MALTDRPFEELLNQAIAELQEKQEALERDFGFGAGGRWQYAQETATLQLFDDNNNMTVSADVIDIGSYHRPTETWMWSWSNDTVLPALRQRAESLKTLEDITGLGVFGQAKPFDADVPMAWELAAICVKHLGALGCYRGPSEDSELFNFFAIMDVKRAEASN